MHPDKENFCCSGKRLSLKRCVPPTLLINNFFAPPPQKKRKAKKGEKGTNEKVSITHLLRWPEVPDDAGEKGGLADEGRDVLRRGGGELRPLLLGQVAVLEHGPSPLGGVLQVAAP